MRLLYDFHMPIGTCAWMYTHPHSQSQVYNHSIIKNGVLFHPQNIWFIIKAIHLDLNSLTTKIRILIFLAFLDILESSSLACCHLEVCAPLWGSVSVHVLHMNRSSPVSFLVSHNAIWVDPCFMTFSFFKSGASSNTCIWNKIFKSHGRLSRPGGSCKRTSYL